MVRNVGIIYEENDYSVFNPLLGNRVVDEYRKMKIRESVAKVGWIKNPIVVNEKFQVIDGQARLEILQEMGLPVQYVIAYGTGVSECIAMNISQSSWRIIDYVTSYAALGNQNYVRMLKLIDDFSEFGVPEITGIARNIIVRNGTQSHILKSGKLELSEEGYRLAHIFLDAARNFLPIIDKIPGSSRTKRTAIAWALRNTGINSDRLYKRLASQYPLISPVVESRPDIFLSDISNIYNKGLAAKNCIYLDAEYKRFERESAEA